MRVFGSLPGHKQTFQANNNVRSSVKAAVTSASCQLQTHAMQRLALCGAGLREQREHVEVVRDALDLPAFDLDDLACRKLNQSFRCRYGTRWCLQRSGVNALPYKLEDSGVPARELAHECGLGIGDGLGPALPSVDDLADALDLTVGSLLVVHGVGSQHFLHLAPVLLVVSGD